MGSNVKALKALYVALGGSADDVASISKIDAMINAIATLMGTTGGVLPAVTSSNNGAVLKVASGKWAIGTDNT